MHKMENATAAVEVSGGTCHITASSVRRAPVVADDHLIVLRADELQVRPFHSLPKELLRQQPSASNGSRNQCMVP